MKKSGIIFLLGLVLSLSANAAEPIQMTWTAAVPSQTLQAWTPKHVLFSSLIEKTLEPLTPTQRAQVDLVILKNKAGTVVQVPRWLITKYPVALTETESKGLQLVLPTSSKPRIKDEGLPLQTYELSDIVSIELSSYQQNYSAYFLKNRMDPLAVRGEKLFVQDCTSCHTGGTGARTPAATAALASHPEITTSSESVKLNSRDIRALASYLSAYRMENAAAPTTAASTGK